MESIGDPEHISRNKEKYVLLEEKTKELGYKVGMLSSIPLSLHPGCSAYPWVLDKHDLLTQGNTNTVHCNHEWPGTQHGRCWHCQQTLCL